MICPYCNASEIAGTEGVFDLGAKVCGEARVAIEARARGLSLHETAKTLVSGERWSGAASDRPCPYCRRSRIPASADTLLIVDLLVLVLGGARRYANAGGWRRLSLRETAQLILDGRLDSRSSRPVEVKRSEQQSEQSERPAPVVVEVLHDGEWD